MKKLCLKVGLSYTNRGFSCKAGSPFDINDEKAGELLATGRFEEIPGAVVNEVMNAADAPVKDDGVPVSDDSAPVNNNGPDGAALSADAVASMTKAELTELAKTKEIDISDCKNKADIVERINGILGLASMVQLGLET